MRPLMLALLALPTLALAADAGAPKQGARATVALPALPPPPAPVVNPNEPPMPTDAQCMPLPPLARTLAFGPGEVLEYDLDALGARAGEMTMRVLPMKDGRMPIEARVETNTFFNKIRKVVGTGTSTVDPKTLRPFRYVEDATENDQHRLAEVNFNPRNHEVWLRSTINGQTADASFRYHNDGLDLAGTIFLLRQLPLRKDLPICFDAYGIRRLWRVWGTVAAREHVSLPVGEFEAWHISGYAARLDYPAMRREIHVWISDDQKRLPLAALGAIDLGTVRATLKAYKRPGERQARSEPKGNLKW
jgi:Protein of unknown function (DUF3108)